MSVVQRGSTAIATESGGDGILSVTLTGAAQPQANDVLHIVHSNDFFALADMNTPTVGGVSTGVASITNVDLGAGSYHMKTWYYVVTSTGDATVQVTEANSGEEIYLAVRVLSGVDIATVIDGSAGSSGTAVDPWTLTGVSPASSDAYLVADAAGNNGGTLAVPGSMTSDYFQTVDVFARGAHEQLAASGATGTRVFDPGSAETFVGVVTAFKTAAGGAVASPVIRFVPVFRPFLLGRTPEIVPLQLQGDASGLASIALGDTAAGDDQLSVDRVDGVQAGPQIAPMWQALRVRPIPLQLQGDASGSASVALDDTAAGADAVTVTAAVPLADTAAGNDALAVTAAAPLADTATGTDAVTVTAAVPLADTAAGNDSLTVTAAVPLADTAASDDVLSVATGTDPYQAGPQIAWMFAEPNAAAFQLRGDTAQAVSGDQSISLTDTAAGSDALTVTAAVPLADTAAGTDAATVAAAVPLADTAGGTDALTVTASVPLDDTATALDSVTAQDNSAPDPYQARALPFPSFAAPFIEPHAKPLQLQGEDNPGQSLTVADTATATDSLTISVSVALTDTAAGADALSAAVAVPLTDLVAASDALALTTVLALTETATGTDLLSVNTGGGIQGNVHGRGPHSSPGNVYPSSSRSIIGSVG